MIKIFILAVTTQVALASKAEAVAGMNGFPANAECVNPFETTCAGI